MIKKILVPVDGSPHSLKAADLASDLAAKYDAEIILLHVLLRGHMPEGLKRALEVEAGRGAGSRADNLVNMPQEIMARVQDPSTRQLTIDEIGIVGKFVLGAIVAACKDKGATKISERVEEGYPADVIIDLAKNAAVDMIVMGSRGLGDLKGLILGSVSHKVGQLAPCTCVTVK